MTITPAILLAASSLVWVSAGWAQPYYVAVTGNDHHPGTLLQPFRTIERAQQALRELKAAGRLTRGASVFLRAGVYPLSRSVEFDERDSGVPGGRILYSAYGGERVSLIGGRAIAGFEPVSDPAIAARFDEAYRDKIVETSLAEQGITDFGAMKATGTAPLELFFGGQPMTLARWPNKSSPNRGWFAIAGVPAEGAGDRFIYVGGRPKAQRWASADDAWLHGFWIYDWWDSFVRLKAVDVENQLLISDQPFVRAEMANQTSGKTVNRNASSVGRRYYALNILEELDEAGEYYVDRKSGKLYFWPPASARGTSAVVSMLETPLLKFRGSSHLTVRGLTLEYGRGDAIVIDGGTGVEILDCTLRNAGGKAVVIREGSGHSIANSRIYEVGDGAVAINAGVKKGLQAAGHRVAGNDIHNYSRRMLTYRAAVDVKGVGITVAHNHIHHAPHAGILLDGNDHTIEYNEFDHVCEQSDDCGAFYSNGLNWTARGTKVRFNSFHDIRGIGGKSQAPAVYLDDFAGSTTVYGNVFYNTFGVKVGGGRSNTVENNIFVNCEPALSLDGRGLTWASASVIEHRGLIEKQLNEVNFTEPPYRTRYPELLTLLDANPGMPLGNRILRNIFVGGTGWIRITEEVGAGVVEIDGNWKRTDPGFVDLAHFDFRLKPDAPVLRTGFQPIPLDRIGPPRRAPRP